MPQLTIDGRSLDFDAGESVIQVAAHNDIEIPHYCWHPRLSVAANCRMCMVEVEGASKLLPACQTECRDGMVVSTRAERVRDAQRAVQEFLLVNHPVDCPICDQAGECTLQDYYMKLDLQGSRVVDAKVSKPRLERLGPNVMYNAERCILCTRCVRFMDEIEGDRQLGVFFRGDHATIAVTPGTELDSIYSLNTVDLCPVGALTSIPFRFRQRAWNLQRSDSLCGGCARGCNIHVDQRSGGVYRLLPRENDAVNRSWMCDEGRLTFQRANDARLIQALVRAPGGDTSRESGNQPESVPVALRFATELLAPYVRDDSGSDSGSDTTGHAGLAIALCLHATLEDAYLVARLATEVLRVELVVTLGYRDGEADDWLRVADKNPNRAGIEAVFEGVGVEAVAADELLAYIDGGRIGTLLCVGHEADGLERLADARAKLAALIQISSAHNPLSEVADVVLPSVCWAQRDGTWVNVDRRAQRLQPAFAAEGNARPTLDWLTELAAGLGVAFDTIAHPSQPSAQTVRAEIERRLDTFKGTGLTDLGAAGRQL